MQRTTNMIVRQYMLSNGLSQDEVAKMLGKDPGNFSRKMAVEMEEWEQEGIVNGIKKYLNKEAD